MQVLLHEPAKSNVSFARKMIQLYSGPFIVRKRITPKVIDISHTLHSKIKRVNIERLKSFVQETRGHRVRNLADRWSTHVDVNAIKVSGDLDDLFVPNNQYQVKARILKAK